MCHSQKTDKMTTSAFAKLTWGVGMAEKAWSRIIGFKDLKI